MAKTNKNNTTKQNKQTKKHKSQKRNKVEITKPAVVVEKLKVECNPFFCSVLLSIVELVFPF